MVGKRKGLVAVGALTTVVLLSSAGGCGSGRSGFGSGEVPAEDEDGSIPSASSSGSSGSGGNGSGGNVFSGSGTSVSGSATTGCSGLACDVMPGCMTSLTGTVYDPAGANPLYNVVVYIPTDPQGTLSPIKQGTNTCNTCEVSIGDYVTATTSDESGNFVLTGVPAATHVPLVVQIGKWRREVFLPEVKACTTTAIPGSSMTRLPAKRSEGDLPQMALVTGGADNLGCFLAGVGLDPGEYSAPHAGGRLDIYQGLPSGGGGNRGGRGGRAAPGLSTGTAGDCTSDNAGCVWNSKANLEAYDIVLLACEGDTYDPAESRQTTTNKTPASKQAMHDWLNEGGKVFATHFHYTWFRNSPDTDFQGVADWLGNSGGNDNALYDIDTSFPKGAVFNQWLGKVGALSGTQINLTGVAESVGAVNAPTQRWIYNPARDPQDGQSNNTKYLSFETPVNGVPINIVDAGESNAQYCGKAVFTDLHAGGSPMGTIPSACAGPPLSAQLKALEFLFFDLSACVSNDSLPPPSPPQPTR
jgi:hypothetical protein